MTNQTKNEIPNFSLITAVTKERGIGYQGDLPWIKTPIHTDMTFYEKVTRHLNVNQDKPFETSEINDTINNVVIMGRVSWECVPIKYRPFRNRINIIVSRNKDLNLEMSDEKLKQYTYIVHSLEDGLVLANKLAKNGSVFVIGGSQLYTQAIQHPNCTKWFITELFDHPELPCDTFFPEYQAIKSSKKDITIEAWEWLNKFKSKRVLPALKKLENGEVYVCENDISYKFFLFENNSIEQSL